MVNFPFVATAKIPPNPKKNGLPPFLQKILPFFEVEEKSPPSPPNEDFLKILRVFEAFSDSSRVEGENFPEGGGANREFSKFLNFWKLFEF